MVQMSAAAPAESAGPLVLRARMARLLPVQLDRALVAGLAGDTSPLLDLNLFDDTTLRAVFERTHSDAFGHRTWVGRVQGDEHSTVTLTWRGDTVVGAVQTATALYRVSGTMDAAVVEQVDPTSFGEEREPLPAPAGDVAAVPAQSAAPAATALDGEVVDVLVYYTTAAKVAQGGAAGIEAVIATGVADANTAYARSGINATLRLVGTAEFTGYTESANMSDDLHYIRSSATVAAGRNAVAADLVALVVAQSTASACGIGFLGPSTSWAFSVTARTCIVGNYTFAHELGHNFGACHAPEDGGCDASQTYAYGYKDRTNNFRTVMAYAPGTRILNFSNPGVMYTGRVTGTATQNNALALRQAFPIVQAFRTAGVTPPTVTGAPQNLTVNAVGSTLGLAWRAPATGTPTSYWVRVGTTPGASNVFDGSVGLALSASVSTPNGTYYVQVYARNAAGFSVPASATVSVNAAAVPGAPQALMGSATGNIVNVKWSPPASGGTVTNYLAQVGTAPGAANVFSGSAGLATAASGGLANGTYYVRLYAQNAAGTSPSSNELMVTVGPPCTMPAVPMLNGSTMGNVIGISWTTPVGGPVVSYTVQAGNASGLSNLYVGSVGLTNAASASVSAGPYFIRVVANAACGSSASSNEVSVTVP